jgi:hypothetical protein
MNIFQKLKRTLASTLELNLELIEQFETIKGDYIISEPVVGGTISKLNADGTTSQLEDGIYEIEGTSYELKDGAIAKITQPDGAEIVAAEEDKSEEEKVEVEVEVDKPEAEEQPSEDIPTEDQPAEDMPTEDEPDAEEEMLKQWIADVNEKLSMLASKFSELESKIKSQDEKTDETKTELETFSKTVNDINNKLGVLAGVPNTKTPTQDVIKNKINENKYAELAQAFSKK